MFCDSSKERNHRRLGLLQASAIPAIGFLSNRNEKIRAASDLLLDVQLSVTRVALENLAMADMVTFRMLHKQGQWSFSWIGFSKTAEFKN